SSNRIAVTPDASTASSALLNFRPATSVMRLRMSHPITSRRAEGAVACRKRHPLHIRARMDADVTTFAALFAGVLSFLSPCVLPLVPPYLVYLAGTSLERFADAEPEPQVRWETVGAACLFVAGFSTVFVALGASASAFGSLIRAYADKLAIVAGVAIIIMGLHFLGLTRLALLYREKRMEVPKPVGLWGAYVMGL